MKITLILQNITFFLLKNAKMLNPQIWFFKSNFVTKILPFKSNLKKSIFSNFRKTNTKTLLVAPLKTHTHPCQILTFWKADWGIMYEAVAAVAKRQTKSAKRIFGALRQS